MKHAIAGLSLAAGACWAFASTAMWEHNIDSMVGFISGGVIFTILVLLALAADE